MKTSPVELDVLEVEWEESCMDEGDDVVRHGGKLKPACCSDLVLSGLLSDSKTPVKVSSEIFALSATTGVNERTSSSISSNYNSGRSCDGCVEDKPSSSGRVDISVSGAPVSRSYDRRGFKSSKELSEAIREEELLDIMLLLYHLGLAQDFKEVWHFLLSVPRDISLCLNNLDLHRGRRPIDIFFVFCSSVQASFLMQHQMQSIAQLDETDRQIRGKNMSRQHLKHLKEARTVYREDLIHCARQCTWYVGSFTITQLLFWTCGDFKTLCCGSLACLFCCVIIHVFALHSIGVQVPCGNVCKMEAQGNVCHLHVACAAIASSKQKGSALRLCSRILC